MAAMAGLLVIAATPIGNPDDASPRLRQVLADADTIAVEDTRRFARLARDLDLTHAADVVSFYEAVEASRIPQLLARLASGHTVVLITDAGMPSVSDPGYRLVAAAAGAGVTVTVVPGPSAVLAALVASGLPSDRFCFEGFPPRKPGERLRWFEALADEPRTLVFFESPRRIGATLAAASQMLGADRPAVVCRELTKTYEEVRRGTVGELAAWASDGLLGEITVVVAGAPAPARADVGSAELAAAVAAVEAAGSTRKEAIKAVALRHGMPKREVFDAVVRQGRVP